jgi:hypothetical protein
LKHFEYHTTSNCEEHPRLLILDGYRSHLTLEFCQYVEAHNIVFFCFSAHSTDLLQPLDVGIFGPLQRFYGKTADDHMRKTRTGVVKGSFWKFYSAARSAAYTPANIKVAFRKTGIYPFNPDAVFSQVPAYSRTVSSPLKHLTILKKPHNRRDLRQQTHLANDLCSEVIPPQQLPPSAALRRGRTRVYAIPHAK